MAGRHSLDEDSYGGVVANSPSAADPLVTQALLDAGGAATGAAAGVAAAAAADATYAKNLLDGNQLEINRVDRPLADPAVHIAVKNATGAGAYAFPDFAALGYGGSHFCCDMLTDVFTNSGWALNGAGSNIDDHGDDYEGHGYQRFYTDAVDTAEYYFQVRPPCYGANDVEKMSYIMYAYFVGDPAVGKVYENLGLFDPTNSARVYGLRKASLTSTAPNWNLTAGDGSSFEQEDIGLDSLTGKHVWLIASPSQLRVWVDKNLLETPTATLAHGGTYPGYAAAVLGLYQQAREAVAKEAEMATLRFWRARAY